MGLNFYVVDAPQRSDEWFAARCGVMTASAAGDMMATIKSGEAAARRDLRVKLAIERLTGSPDTVDLSGVAAVQRGIELEPSARMRFEAERLVKVRQTGFLKHVTLPVGASLDGDINDFREVLEIKCPKSATHIDYLTAGGLPRQYLWQVTHAVWLTGAERAHFVSFDDRLPEGLDYYEFAIDRAELPIDNYVDNLMRFLAEVDQLHEQLIERTRK